MRSVTLDRGGWILSRRQDLIWFQGSALAGIALVAIFMFLTPFKSGGFPNSRAVIFAVFLWGALFDGTHVWGTYVRTYFAPDRASRAQLPGSWSFAVFAIGPFFALLAEGLGSPAAFQFFLLGAYLWAYWHLVRQHYGFVMLYRKRADETDPRGAQLDALVLWAGCLFPFILFSLSGAYRQSGLPQFIPGPLISPIRLGVSTAFVAILTGAIALIASERIEPLRLGPKHLLIAVVIGFHVLVFFLLGQLLTILAALTIFHNLQYHRIVWMYERGLGRTPAGGLLPYVMQGVLFGAIWYVVRVIGASAAHSDLQRNVLLGLAWGVAFHHYMVDGRIWHVRSSATVSRALRQEGAS